MKNILDETADLILEEYDKLCEMTNLTPKRTNLSVEIWSDHGGIARQVEHNEPRAKVGPNQSTSYSVTLTKDCHVIATQKDKFNREQKDVIKAMKQAMRYIARNLDLFIKHYEDTTDEFDDDDLKDVLRERGEYK